jgi:hypothetical protein
LSLRLRLGESFLEHPFQLAEALQLAGAVLIERRRELHQVAAAVAEGAGEIELITEGVGVTQGGDHGAQIRCWRIGEVELAVEQHQVARGGYASFHQGAHGAAVTGAVGAVIA